jgi:hypothetical protein
MIDYVRRRAGQIRSVIGELHYVTAGDVVLSNEARAELDGLPTSIPRRPVGILIRTFHGQRGWTKQYDHFIGGDLYE